MSNPFGGQMRQSTTTVPHLAVLLCFLLPVHVSGLAEHGRVIEWRPRHLRKEIGHVRRKAEEPTTRQLGTYLPLGTVDCVAKEKLERFR